jgi:hypothetical protein
MNQAREIIREGSEEEAIFLLRVLEPHSIGTKEILAEALQRNSYRIRKSALLVIQGEDRKWHELIRTALSAEQEPELIHMMLEILLSEEVTVVLSNYIEHPDENIQMACIGLLLKFPSHPQYLEAADKVKKMVSSDSPERIVLGLSALGDSGRPGIVTLDKFFDHSNIEVVTTAIKTARKTRDISVMPHLFRLLSVSKFRPELITTLGALGNSVVTPVLDRALITTDTKLRGALLILLANHSSKQAVDALFKLLKEWPIDMPVILIHLVDHKYAHTLKGKVNPLIVKLQDRAEKLICLHHSLTNKPKYVLLAESIEIEFHRYRKYLLQCMYLNHSDERLRKTFAGILAKQKDIVASSVELLEQVCGQQAAAGFIRLYEPMSNFDRINELRRAGRFKSFSNGEAIEELLTAQEPAYSNWLQSLALHTMIKGEAPEIDIPDKITQSNDTMIRELIDQIKEQQIK